MYDVIVIGCGPAGMTAAIYALRAGKKVLILEKEGIGGQISSSPLVENYPGYKSISGSDLANNLYEQVITLGGKVELEEVLKIKDGKIKEVTTDEQTYKTKTIIIATGAKYRLLGLDNEINLIGNGIHFCVSCDGAFYKDKVVAVIGGGNSAIINACTLADLCKKVYVIQNISTLTCENLLSSKLKEKKNAEIYCNSIVTKINGTDELESIIIDNNGKEEEIKLDGMFISIGLIPQSEMFKDLIELNDAKYIVADDNCETNIPGIFVAGDCRNKNIRQLTTAVNDGTIAAINAIKYIDK
ncbi:MAG TPA: FAD-dependent oxidoreductase [Bacilli bacterium]|nr:FAD-dependent oxidoreductase [Bacilli bacterium]